MEYKVKSTAYLHTCLSFFNISRVMLPCRRLLPLLELLLLTIARSYIQLSKLSQSRLSSLRSTPLSPRVSYIEDNAPFEGQISLEQNSGVGKEEYLYIDDDIIVVNKPANIQTAPGYVDPVSLATIIRDRFNISRIDQMIVHRLDYSTSGIVIYGRNMDALRDLHRQFRTDGVFKRYSSIVNGILQDNKGEISYRIGKDIKSGPPIQCIDEGGKEAITRFEVYERGQYTTLVHLFPKTGRYGHT